MQTLTGEWTNTFCRMTLMVRALPIIVLSTLLTGCGFSYAVGPGKDRRTPLEKAVQTGDVTEVKRLLKTGVDPNGTGDFGSPLNSATMREGNLEIIQALLAAGANPNGKDKMAIYAGRPRFCTRLQPEISIMPALCWMRVRQSNRQVVLSWSLDG